MVRKEKITLSVGEVCVILSACVESGVTTLKFGDLHVEFGGKPTSTEPALSPVTEITEENHKASTAKAVEADELTLMDERIALLQLENPLLAEELIRSGELEEDANG